MAENPIACLVKQIKSRESFFEIYDNSENKEWKKIPHSKKNTYMISYEA